MEAIHFLFVSQRLKEYKASFVGGAPTKDIAVLKLDSLPKDLTPVTIGKSSNLVVGEKAFAIGNPLALIIRLQLVLSLLWEEKFVGIQILKSTT